MDRCTDSIALLHNTASLLRDLHWLRVLKRIQFRLCVLAYYCLHGTAPAYLADSLQPTSEVVDRRRLWSADTTTLMVPPTQWVTFSDHAFPFRWLRHNHGTVCYYRLGRLIIVVFSAAEKGPSVSPVIRLLNVPAFTLTDGANHAAPF